MGDALRKKGFSDEIVERTLRDLEKKGLLGDEGFAREWAYSRVTARLLGRKRLRQELAEKGVASSIIAQVQDEVYRENPEEELALRAAKKRLRALSGVDPVRARRRLAGYLERRGFSFEVIGRVLEEVENTRAGETT